jgi:hypothetical protein
MLRKAAEQDTWAGFSIEHFLELMKDKSFLCKFIMIVVWNTANKFTIMCDKMLLHEMCY